MQKTRIFRVLSFVTAFLFALSVILGTILTFTLYLDGVRRIGPARGSMISAVEPVSASLFAVCWLGTPLTGVDFVGFACIFAMILLLAHK